MVVEEPVVYLAFFVRSLLVWLPTGKCNKLLKLNYEAQPYCLLVGE